VKGSGMKRERIIRVVVIAAVAGLAIWAGMWVYGQMTGKIVVSVDYLAKFNEMRKPEGYDPNEDGTDLYVQACSAAEGWSVPDFGIPGVRIPWPGDLNDADLKQVRNWLAQNNETMKLAEESVAKKHCWLKRDSKGGYLLAILLPELGGVKNLTYAFAWRGKVKAFDGDAAGGLRDTMLPSQLGCAADCKGATIIEWLVGTAVSGMCNAGALDIAAHTNLTSRELADLAAEIERIDSLYTAGPPTDAENLTFYDVVQRTFTDNGHGDGRPIRRQVRELMPLASAGAGPGGVVSTMLSRIWPMYRLESRKATLARWDRVMEANKRLMAMEPWQVAADANKPWKQLEKEASANTVVQMLMGSWERIAVLNGRHTVSVRGTLAAIAVLRYSCDKGGLPHDWGQVVAGGYLKEIPIDSFSGQPLVFRMTGDEFTVYSVGQDGKDDGGTDRKSDIVVWPVEEKK